MVDDRMKDSMRKHLERSKDSVKNMKETLTSFPEADEARKALLDTEFSILRAIHKISWIGEKHEDEQEEILSHTDKRENPSG